MNISETINLIRSALLAPQPTWQEYLAKNRSWKETLLVLTLPLIVGSVLLNCLLTLLVGASLGMSVVVSQILYAIITFAVFTLVLAALAGSFGGITDFDRATAAISLSGVPAYVAGAVTPIPVIGFLIALAGGIYSLVLLYQIIPVYLNVPEDKRVIHFIVTIVAALVVSMILFGLLLPTPDYDNL